MSSAGPHMMQRTASPHGFEPGLFMEAEPISLFVCRCCDSSLCSVEPRFPLKRRYCSSPNLPSLFLYIDIK